MGNQSFKQRHAKNLVVMLTAGGAMDDVLEMAKAFGVKSVHVQQLATPNEERSSQQRLIQELKNKSN